MSQRDVPGMTRSLIPLLVSNSVQAVTVGVNTVSMPPAVPSVFLWQDPVSETEVVAMWHPHGYGGQDGPSMDSVVMVPGMPVALAFAIRGDNSGPPSAMEVLRNYAKLSELFPSAKIVASGYDEFVRELVKYKSALPVYSGEIGDTWIQGVASDPWKTAVTREMMRLRSKCLESGACTMNDERFVAFSMMLLKSGEHTWGKDIKKFLNDTTNWDNQQFHPLQYTDPKYVDVTKSWIEQRVWGTVFPQELLGDHPLRAEIETAVAALRFNGTVDTTGYKRLENVSTVFKCGGLEVQFSNKTSGIIRLVDMRQPSKPVSYADSSSHQLATVLYQTFLSEDYEKFFSEYLYDSHTSFARQDFGKPGWNGFVEASVNPYPTGLWYKEDKDTCTLLLSSVFYYKDWIVEDFGGAEKLWTQVTLPKTSSTSATLHLNLTVYLTNKTATRIPESLSLLFNPLVSNPADMTVSKL